jgi:hypothetical protein
MLGEPAGSKAPLVCCRQHVRELHRAAALGLPVYWQYGWVNMAWAIPNSHVVCTSSAGVAGSTMQFAFCLEPFPAVQASSWC